MNKLCLVGALAAVACASQASLTIATFSDPSLSASNPLFAWDSAANTLEGSWSGTGMTVQTPGFIGGGSVSDAQMVFDQVSLTPIINGTFYKMGSGRVRFFTTDINNPFLTITFNSGSFLNPFLSGASSLNADGVSFTGPNVPTGLSDEQFSFSFANPETSGSVTHFTSSFTSSAVPEPLSIIALGAGLAALGRRRKKA